MPSIPLLVQKPPDHSTRESKLEFTARSKSCVTEDLAHISKVHIYWPQADHSWTPGYLNSSSDVWSMWFPQPQRPDHRAKDLYLPVKKAKSLEKAGFETHSIVVSRLYTTLIVHFRHDEDIERAREIIGRAGLSKGELICPSRIACGDLSQGPWA